MHRQVERGLFQDDSAIHTETESKQEQRPLDEHALQLADEPKKKNANKGTSITIEGMRAILIRQQYRCALSGVVLSPDCASLDHITPLSKGGTHTLDNVQIVHPVVNALKGEMASIELIRWARLIASQVNDDTDGEW